MKSKKIIMGLVLSVGLLVLAPVQTKAIPLFFLIYDIKIIGSMVNDKNQIVRFAISNKDILTLIGAPKGSRLVAPFFGPHDIWVMSGKEMVRNLTADNVFSCDYPEGPFDRNEIVTKNGTVKSMELRTVTYIFQSNGNSGYANNEFGFEISGGHIRSEKESALRMRDNTYTHSVNLSSPNLVGVGYDGHRLGVFPVMGSVSGHGHARIQAYLPQSYLETD